MFTRLRNICLLLMGAGIAFSASPSSTEAPPPPEVSEASDATADASAEPEIRIIRRVKTTEQEYWVNGKRYMVKVMPRIGAPYYLMDQNGSGEMKQVDPSRTTVVPEWVLIDF